MKLTILDWKSVSDRQWALCKGNLLDYLKGLKVDFFEFSVQRKIVNNLYLDSIYESIDNGEPFPAITLTYQGNIAEDIGSELDIEEEKIEILDGLQRTYRLWIILFFDEVIKNSGASDFKSLVMACKQTEGGEAVLQNKFVTPKFIKKLLIEQDGNTYISKLLESYAKFDVYFYIWTGLDDKTIIKKMLILNAGQKSVTSIHQFELLFLHFFEGQKLDYNRAITLVREKDKRYKEVQMGRRNQNEFLMSSVVIALQSFINGKPLRVNTVNKVSLEDDTLLDNERLEGYFNAEVLSEFINVLYSFGEMLGEDYIKWYGKDTVLSGLYGAIGSYLKDNSLPLEVSEIYNQAKKLSSNRDPFELTKYYDAYDNKLASTKVNVGNAVRKAIFNYTKELLTNEKSNWYTHFSRYKDDDTE